jgi:hypothetical protein
MNKYKQLTLPKKSYHNRKIYNPYTLFDHWFYKKSKDIDWVDNIYHYWDKFIDTPINNVTQGITNLYKYFRVIWKNREWDYVFTYELLQRKIEVQREYLINRNSFTSTDIRNRDMTLILNLLERTKTDYYSDEPFDYYDLNINFVKVENSKQELYTMESKYSNERYNEYLEKYPRTVKLVKEKYTEKNDHDLCMEVGHHLQQKCNRILHKLLEEKLEGFWD